VAFGLFRITGRYVIAVDRDSYLFAFIGIEDWQAV